MNKKLLILFAVSFSFFLYYRYKCAGKEKSHSKENLSKGQANCSKEGCASFKRGSNA